MRAIEQHALVLAIDQADRHVAVGVLARDHDIEGVVGEHLRPIGQALLVERRRIGAVEFIDLAMQQQRFDAPVIGD